jgi:hypothetical protein
VAAPTIIPSPSHLTILPMNLASKVKFCLGG